MRRDSTSSLSSSASDYEETIQIFVKDVAGNTTPLSLPPTSLKLTHAGRHLAPTSTLTTSHLTNHSTVSLTLPILGGMAPSATARRKNLCAYETTKNVVTTDPETGDVTSAKKSERCREQAQRIVGECGFCARAFCSKHRLLEAHECPGLEDCKTQDRLRNAMKLESERTVAIRGV